MRQGYVNALIASMHSEEEEAALRSGLAQLEFPDARTRTAHHRSFNTRLAPLCEGAGIGFIDPFDRLCDGGGVLDPAYILSHGGSDHHLDVHAPATRELAREILRAVVGDNAESTTA